MSVGPTTVLFTDMEGSTEVATARGDEAAMALLRVHERVVRTAVAAFGGRVVKSTGDGFLAVFPSSVDGVSGALQVRDALDEHNAARPAEALRVRLGLHTGPVTELAGDVHGLTVSAASRVAAKARSGQVLVSEPVTDGAGGGDVRFVDRGLFWLKGIHEQWRLYEATTGEALDPAPSVERSMPFVGRDAERALLRRCAEAAHGGQGGLAMVTGSSGSGKTRLVEEVGAEAQASGMRYLVGRAHETGRNDPYLPFVEILEGVERHLSPAVFREVLGDAAQQVGRLLPELRRRHPDIPPPVEGPTHLERRQLFSSVRDVLARAAAIRPLLLLLDDLHWADEPSVLLLEHLAGELPGLPIALVATTTPEELTPASPLHPVLARLHRRRLVQTITMGALAEPDVERLLRAIGGRPPPAPLVRAFFQVSAGSPLFIDELVRHLTERGRLFDDVGEWRRELDATELDVPEGVRIIVERRLERLQPGTRRVLGIASLIGRDFGFDLLEGLVDLGEELLLDALDEAERARLLTSSVEGADVRFGFAHEIVRRTLVDGLSLTRRQHLHLRVADAIERVSPSAREQAAAIAYHLEAAGGRADPKRTLRYLVLAGERALEAAGYDEALQHHSRALALVSDDDAEARAQLLERMATAERSLGHLDDALSLWGEALDVYDRLGRTGSVARLCLDAAVQVAWWRRGSELTALVQRGLAALGDSDSAHRAGLLALAGRIQSQAGSFTSGEELLVQALGTARRHDDDRVLGLTLYSLAVHHYAYCHHEETVTVGLESVEHLRRTSDGWDLANVLGYVGTSLGWLGRFDEAAEVGAEGEVLARRLGNWSAYVFAEQAQGFRVIGNDPAPTLLEERGRQALDLGRDLDFPWLTSVGHGRIGLAAFWRGRWEDALVHFEEAASLEVRGAAGGHLGRLFLLHAYLGHRSTALDLVERARPDFPTPGRPASGTSWSLAGAALEAFVVLGEDEGAAALYDTVLGLAATGDLMRSWDFRLVPTLAGMAASCRSDWAVAEAHFEESLRLAAELPMRLEAPEARRFLAGMHLARDAAGDRERAGALLRDAASDYATLGMPRHEALARELLVRADGPDRRG